MKNVEIRTAIKKAKLTHWEVAEIAGISEFTLCRWLRKELEGEQKTVILRAIEMLTNKKRGEKE